MTDSMARARGARRRLAGPRSEAWIGAALRGTFASSDLGGGRPGYRAAGVMVRMGYAERLGRRSAGCRYRATLLGRCMAAGARLGVGFVPLCLAAEARAMHLMQDECGADRAYPVYLLQEALEGLYSAKTVLNSASALCSAGMAERVREGALRLLTDDFGGFEPALAELHEWVAGARDRAGAAALSGGRRP